MPDCRRECNAGWVALSDCVFLALVVVLSLVLYVDGLGLYSDDWGFLGAFFNASDQSLTGLVRVVIFDMAARPVQSLYLATLYWFFGPEPLGYHVVNGVVFTTSILLFYCTLRELRLVRIITLLVPLVFSLLPHYSTDRFWIAAFQANLCIGLYFLSLYADLRAVRLNAAGRWIWKLVAATSLGLSVLAYEVAAPLFLLNFVIVWFHARRIRTARDGTGLPMRVVIGSNAGVLALATAYKYFVTDRATIYGSYLFHILNSAGSAFSVNFGSYGFDLPYIIVRIFYSYPDMTVFTVGGLLGLIVFAYLYTALSRSHTPWLSPAIWLKVAGAGVVVFGLGYGVLLSTSHVGFSTTGIQNRTAIAAALGVAFCYVGGVGWITSLLPSERLRRCSFAALIATVCVGGFLIINTIARFWIAASRRQHNVIAAVRERFPTLPPGTTLLLDGVCLYVGPGIVFEASWDVGGMLQMYYRDPTLSGDIVKRNVTVPDGRGNMLQRSVEVSTEGIFTMLYDEKEFYPYSDKLALYHIGRRQLLKLTDFASAQNYFKMFGLDKQNGCPSGSAGYGARIF